MHPLQILVVLLTGMFLASVCTLAFVYFSFGTAIGICLGLVLFCFMSALSGTCLMELP